MNSLFLILSLSVSFLTPSAFAGKGFSLSTFDPKAPFYDLNHNGIPELVKTFDSQGKLKSIQIDANEDQKPDSVKWYRPDGLLKKEETDRNFDGKFDRIEEFIKFPKKTTVKIKEDRDFNGSFEVQYQDTPFILNSLTVGH